MPWQKEIDKIKVGEKIDEGFRLIAMLILAQTQEEREKIEKKILSEE